MKPHVPSTFLEIAKRWPHIPVRHLGPESIPMDLETAARCFAELGHPSRLAVYQRLVQAGDAGMPVGAIAEELGIVLSTLSHHIKQLVHAGLVAQVRDGRTLICRPLYPQMDALVAFLTEQCCARPAAQVSAETTCC